MSDHKPTGTLGGYEIRAPKRPGLRAEVSQLELFVDGVLVALARKAYGRDQWNVHMEDGASADEFVQGELAARARLQEIGQTRALTEASPLNDLIGAARLLAGDFGIRNPAKTVMATEPLRFWSEDNARAWLHLNRIAITGHPHDIGNATVVTVQIGVYSLVAQWPSQEI